MKEKGAITTGILAAIAASSCCLPPLITALAGVGGVSSSLSWIEPLRPYLIGLAVIAIGYAWFVHLKSKKQDDCGCSVEKPKWYQTRAFLVGMTVFAFLSISFPYYSGYFFPDNAKGTVIENIENIETVEVTIEGMTCDACQKHVDYSVNELDGIVDVKTSYDLENSIIQFDNTKTSQKEITEAINSTGYTVTEIKIKEQNE